MRVTKEYSRNKSWKIALIVGIVVLAVAVMAGYCCEANFDQEKGQLGTGPMIICG